MIADRKREPEKAERAHHNDSYMRDTPNYILKLYVLYGKHIEP